MSQCKRQKCIHVSAVKAHCSLNMDCELLTSVDAKCHEYVASFLQSNHADRESILKSGTEVIEAQFEPVMVNDHQHVAVLITCGNDINPGPFTIHNDDNGDKYLLVDADYASFFREQRFASTTKTLRDNGLFEKISSIRKVYLSHGGLYKDHRVQHYLPGGKVNPQFDDTKPTQEVFTLAVGNGTREEVLKYALFGEQLMFGPYNPVIPELLATPDDKSKVMTFLKHAHFIKSG